MLSEEKKTAVGAFISLHQFKTTMKFKFKIQQYQSNAVESTVSVFTGQPSRDAFQFRRDLGKKADTKLTFEEEYTGYRNGDIELDDKQLLDNIRKIQEGQDIKQSPKLVNDLGRLGLDRIGMKKCFFGLLATLLFVGCGSSTTKEEVGS